MFAMLIHGWGAVGEDWGDQCKLGGMVVGLELGEKTGAGTLRNPLRMIEIYGIPGRVGRLRPSMREGHGKSREERQLFSTEMRGNSTRQMGEGRHYEWE